MSYEQAQDQLQNSLVTTFLANLTFLSEYDNALYQKVDQLSQMINECIYAEKYRLEFLEDKGDFDIYDIKNDSYLYNENPKSWNDKIVSSFQLDAKSSILSLEEALYSGKTVDIDSNVKYHLEDNKEANAITLNEISEYVSELGKISDKKRIKKINKVIFLGTLLGRHISRIAKKFDSDIYLVVEKNLEIFRLSLFVTDYTALADKDGVIFSIMEDSYTYEKKVVQFLQINPFDNYLIKLSATDINVKKYLDSTLSAVLNTKASSFDYNRILYNFVRNVSLKFNNSNNILLTNKLKENFNLFNNKPLIFIGAGPSLDDHIDWIKDNQKNFFIVTIGSATRKLISHEIKIDMIFSLDGQYKFLKGRQFQDAILSSLENTIILASMITPDEIINRFKKENVFIYEVFSNFHQENKIFDVYSVGEQSIALLLEMNVKELYLVGLDLSLDKNTGTTHSSGTSHFRNFDTNNSDKIVGDKEIYGLRTRAFEVEGNFEQKVHTTGLFSSSIYALNNILAKKDDDVNIYNLSTHGALFVNTIPKKVENIVLDNSINSDISISNVIDFLLENSTTSLPNDKINDIKEEIKYINQVIKNELLNLKENNFANYNEFYIGVINMLSKLTTFRTDIDIFTTLINNNTQIIFNYLNFYFNDTKIKNEDKKVRKIESIYFKQLDRLLLDYLGYLKKIVYE